MEPNSWSVAYLFLSNLVLVTPGCQPKTFLTFFFDGETFLTFLFFWKTFLNLFFL